MEVRNVKSKHFALVLKDHNVSLGADSMQEDGDSDAQRGGYLKCCSQETKTDVGSYTWTMVKRLFGLLILRAPRAQNFLTVIPIEGLGQHMSALEYRTILKYRLMIPLLPVDEPCPVCRKVCLDSFGEHAVHCKELPGFKYRHDLVRDVLSTLRPADILVFGWAGEKHACVDLTGVSPLVGLMDNGFVARQAALKAESSKVAKHEKVCLENQHVFIPFAFDTFGFLAPEAEEFLTRVQRVVQSWIDISYHLEVQEYKDLLVASAEKRSFRNDVKVLSFLGNSDRCTKANVKWLDWSSGSTGVRLSYAIKFWAAMRVLGFEGLSKLVVRHKAFFESQKVSWLLVLHKVSTYSKRVLESFLFVEVINMGKRKFKENSQKALTVKAYSALILYLGDRVLPEITKEKTATEIWKKLETLYMRRSLANHLYLKKKLYTFHMHQGKSQSEHIDEFHKLVGNLVAIDTAISNEDQALLLLTSLPSSYDSFVETLIYGRDTLKLADVLATLNSRELQKMTEAKGDGGEGLYVRRRSGQRDMEQGTYSAWSKSHGKSSRLMCYICQSKEHLKRDCPKYNHKKSQGFVRNEDQVSNLGADGSDYLFDFEEYDGDNILLVDGRECWVRGIEAYITLYEEWGRQTFGCSSDTAAEWAEDTTMSTYLMNRSPLSAIGFKTPEDMLEFLVGLLVLRNGCLNRLRSSTYSWDTIKVRVQCRCCKDLSFEVNRRSSYIEVEPHGNFDHSKETQVMRLLLRQLLAVDKIYAHESLTFNNTVACEQPVTTAMAITGSIHQVLQREVVGSQEYEVVCTRPDIASVDVGMLDGFDRGLQICAGICGLTTPWVDRSLSWVDQSQATYMTLTEAAKEAIWLNGLAIESGFELKIVAGIATGALSKAIPGSRFQH
ncbi:putative reverse transcriptase domain-containing protein [Tanacetum coccineum]